MNEIINHPFWAFWILVFLGASVAFGIHSLIIWVRKYLGYTEQMENKHWYPENYGCEEEHF